MNKQLSLSEVKISNTLSRLLEKYPNEDWNWIILSQNPSFTMDQILKYSTKVNKLMLAENPNLTINFIKNNLWLLNNPVIFSNPAIFPLILEKSEIIKKIDWSYLSMNPALTEEFIFTNINKLDLFYLAKNPATNMKIINYIMENASQDELDLFMSNVYRNPNLNIDFINKHISPEKTELLINPALTEEYIDGINDKQLILGLSGNPNLSIKFIQTNIKKLNLVEVVANSKYINEILSIKEIKETIDIFPETLFKNSNIKMDYIKYNYIEKLSKYNSYNLFMNPKLPISLINFIYEHSNKKIKDLIDWRILSGNKFSTH